MTRNDNATPPEKSISPAGIILLEKATEGAITWHTLRVQVGVFFGTAVFIALGIAFGQKNATLIVLTGCFIWVIIPIDAVIRTAIARTLLVATEVLPDIDPSNRIRYLEFALLPSDIIRRLLKEQDLKKRDRLLWLHPYIAPSPIGIIAPLLGGAVMIAIGFALLWYGGWSIS